MQLRQLASDSEELSMLMMTEFGISSLEGKCPCLVRQLVVGATVEGGCAGKTDNILQNHDTMLKYMCKTTCSLDMCTKRAYQKTAPSDRK